MENKPEFQPLAANKPYKWIRREIEESDPYQDYEKIFRLTMEYGGDSTFMGNIMYILSFPNFVASERGAKPVVREDGGKLLYNSTDRMYETLTTTSTWWFYGPRHPTTKKSVDMINNRHRYYAKQYPGVFSNPMDYTYVLCFSGLMLHRFRLRLGLSGFSDKQKIGVHLCVREYAKLILVEQPGDPSKEWLPLSTVDTFPKDWDGMVAFCEYVENNHMEVTQGGHAIAEIVLDHFAYSYFPRFLRPLGRAIPITLSLPQTLAAHRIKPVNPILSRIILFLLGTFIWFAETFLPDPKIASRELTEERLRTRKAQDREARKKLDQSFSKFFVENNQGAIDRCPFKLKDKRS